MAKMQTVHKTKEETAAIVAALTAIYPDPTCALEYHGDAWKLMVMGRLSAQCTDARVNIVCRDLFAKYPTARDLADAEVPDVEAIIRSCGLYHGKAVQIVAECKMLCDEYGGVLPDTMEELLKFPGVGRKIANLLLGDIYHLPAVVTDTHCIRICGRLGFYPETLKDPVRVEKILVPLIEPREQSDFCHRLVWFGRETCTAPTPHCNGCPLQAHCAHFQNKGKETK